MVAHATGIITTVAGTGTYGFAGDGGPAIDAEFRLPEAIAIDSAGNLFITELDDSVVREIHAATGIINTVAGIPNPGDAAPDGGDGGLATSAVFNYVVGIAVDASDDIFISEDEPNMVREVDGATGIVVQVVGSGVYGYGGDGGPAIDAVLRYPDAVALDSAGNLYVADTINARVRVVGTAPLTSLILTTTTLAPSATSISVGQSLTLTATVTAASGTTPTGTVTFLWLNLARDSHIERKRRGDTHTHSSDRHLLSYRELWRLDHRRGVDLVPARRRFSHWHRNIHLPWSYPLLSEFRPDFATDSGSTCSQRCSATGTITFLNGTTSLGTQNVGAGGIATLKRTLPAGNYSIVASYGGSATDDPSVSPADLVFVSQFPGNSPDIYAFAGDGNQDFSGDGGPATGAELNTPYAIALDFQGNAFIADRANNRVRRVDAGSGVITTIVGTGTAGPGGDGGLAVNAELDGPSGIAVDAAGDVYISDADNQRVRRVDASSGIISTYAGNVTGGATGIGDGGPATSAHLLFPAGLALDTAGNLYIADEGHNLIREVTLATGIINTVAGTMNGAGGYGGDGGPATSAFLLLPTGVAVDSAGNIYIADTDNDLIREVNASTGIITTVAGNGGTGYDGDGGPATQFAIWGPSDVVVDASGNLYIADLENTRVRKVTAATGIITTYAGIGLPGNAGDGGPANFAYINRPEGLGFDKKGNLYIADTDNNCVRIVGQKPEYGIATTTTLTASATSLTAGQSLTLTATVTAASGAPTTGTVTFLNGLTSLGTGILNAGGVATLTFTPATGTYSITANYGGSSTDASSVSAPPIIVTVALIATTTTLVAAPTSLIVGQSLTLTATVAAVSGAIQRGQSPF